MTVLPLIGCLFTLLPLSRFFVFLFFAPHPRHQLFLQFYSPQTSHHLPSPPRSTDPSLPSPPYELTFLPSFLLLSVFSILLSFCFISSLFLKKIIWFCYHSRFLSSEATIASISSIARRHHQVFSRENSKHSRKLKPVTVVKVEVRLINPEIRKAEVKAVNSVVVTELARFDVAYCRYFKGLNWRGQN